MITFELFLASRLKSLQSHITDDTSQISRIKWSVRLARQIRCSTQLSPEIHTTPKRHAQCSSVPPQDSRNELNQDSISPGNKFPLTPNILPVTAAVYPSTCLAYCSTCLEFNITSKRFGSTGNLNNFRPLILGQRRLFSSAPATHSPPCAWPARPRSCSARAPAGAGSTGSC